MRKQLLVILPLLALVLMAAAADTPNTGTDATHAAVQALNVVRGEDGISVEITARGAVTPKLSTLASPARVVIDLPNTVAATSQRHLEVGSDGVKGVRVGMDGQTPPSTRVVVDLDQACKFELVPTNDNRIVVRLHPGTPTAKASKSSVTVTAAAPKSTQPAIVGAVAKAAPVTITPAVVEVSSPIERASVRWSTPGVVLTWCRAANCTGVRPCASVSCRKMATAIW